MSPKAKAERYEVLKAKRAWDLAISPAKQLPMQMVMVYFSGGGVQIFSMGMVAMLLAAPFKAFAGMNEGERCCTKGCPLALGTKRCAMLTVILLPPFLTAFSQFAPEDSSNPRAFTTLMLQKIVYILCNVLTLLVGAYKCHQMGLLPVGTGDWLAFERRGEVSAVI